MADVLAKILDQVAGRAAKATVTDVCVGVHWTFVELACQGDQLGGLASSLAGGVVGEPDHHHGGGPSVQDAGQLLSYSVSDLASLVISPRLCEASVGMATINALLDVDERACVDVNAADVIAERGAGRNIAVVGHFPFVPQLQPCAKNLWVLELHPRAGDLPASQAPEILPQADVVALTGTSLLNRTFEDLLALCRPDAFVVVLGATTPLSPVLFEAGVHAVAGTIVVNPQAVKCAVGQAATFRQIPGKRLVTMFGEGATVDLPR